MNTTPPPVKPYDHPDPHMWVWTPNEIRWIKDRDAQWMERITALEAQKQELREALRLLRNYTAACEALLNVKPAGQIGIADTALENTND